MEAVVFTRANLIHCVEFRFCVGKDEVGRVRADLGACSTRESRSCGSELKSAGESEC